MPLTRRNPGCGRCGYEFGCRCKPRPPARDRRRMQPDEPRCGDFDGICGGPRYCGCECGDRGCFEHMGDDCEAAIDWAIWRDPYLSRGEADTMAGDG